MEPDVPEKGWVFLMWASQAPMDDFKQPLVET
jgi:hypothetical protein